jgi:hypothetical protein
MWVNELGKLSQDIRTSRWSVYPFMPLGTVIAPVEYGTLVSVTDGDDKLCIFRSIEFESLSGKRI